jgi:trans-aconitate methyltransferase
LPKRLLKIYNELLQFYRDKLRRHGPLSPGALSYNSRESQVARFTVLAKIIPDRKNTYMLLDAGCGLGDFANYLNHTGFGNIAYTGIDVVPEMIQTAQRKFPQYTFFNRDILQENGSYDFTVASGTLNIVYESPEKQFAYLTKMITKLFSCSARACAFNLLAQDRKHEFEQDDLFYYSDQKQILAFCRTLTKNVELIADYLPHDFTVVLRK